MAKTLRLETATLVAEFAPSGAMVGMKSKLTGWKIQRRAELGLSFQMAVPLADRRNNKIDGVAQDAPAVKKLDGGNGLQFTWSNLRSRHGGVHDITFTGIVRVEGDGLLFEGSVINHSGLTIETVTWPCIGDVDRPAENKLDRVTLFYDTASPTPIYPTFHNQRGYFGVDHPIQYNYSHDSLFMLLDSGKQGLYAAVHDTEHRELVAFCNELKPGIGVGNSENNGLVPESDTISGHPVHVEFSAVHFPYVNAGETAKLAPIVLQPYHGTWHKGVDIYKAWRKTWFKPAPNAPAWVKDVHSWQQLHINSPEDELRCRYTDLVKYGRECARHGVKAIQVVGWNDGGQDRGNPSHNTDERLGTPGELAEAIRKCRELGVEIILFNKYNWADQSTEWFREELVDYAAKDPFGDYYMHPGYQYQTHVQLSDINTRRLIPMCFMSKEWREIACREFKKSVDLGAGGMLYDENCHHWPVKLCFDPTHGHHVPAMIHGGDAPLEREFHQVSDPIKADYLFAGEACYDLQHRHYHASYFRVWDARSHLATQRYIDSDTELLVAVAGFNDRLVINRCLMCRYVFSYEPFYFKGHLDDFPLTLKYGKKVDALRRQYRQYLWDAEFRDTVGATVTVDDKPHEQYSVFKGKGTKRAVVVANMTDKPIKAGVTLEGADKPVKWQAVSPEVPRPRASDGNIEVPPLSVVVLLKD